MSMKAITFVHIYRSEYYKTNCICNIELARSAQAQLLTISCQSNWLSNTNFLSGIINPELNGK